MHPEGGLEGIETLPRLADGAPLVFLPILPNLLSEAA